MNFCKIEDFVLRADLNFGKMFDTIFNRYMNLLLFYFRAAFRLFYYITNDTYHVAF